MLQSEMQNPEMKKPVIASPSRIHSKVVLWVLIAVYTFLLPQARVVYEFLVRVFGQAITGKVPLALVVLVALGYGWAVFRSQKNLKNLAYLIPCAVIAYIIIRLEPNPNKHIHIPEYVLMAWLMFAVISRDFRQKSILVLIFFLASLTGVVDELEQGIHPARFYGWSDMVVNSASALIGVFTIRGLKVLEKSEWVWLGQLKKLSSLVLLGLFGLAGVVVMCVYLFQVQAQEAFWGVYPRWLWSLNILFLVLVPLSVFLLRHWIWHKPIIERNSDVDDANQAEMKIARLWLLPALAILFYMHALIVFVSVTGMEFR